MKKSCSQMARITQINLHNKILYQPDYTLLAKMSVVEEILTRTINKQLVMKRLPLILFLLLSINAFPQNDWHSFQGGLEAGLSLSTIYPFHEFYIFSEGVNYFEKKGLHAGLFVNRFVSDYHQLETGLYFTQKGITCKLGYITINKSLNYIEMPLVLNFFPHYNKLFCYSFGLGYFHLINGAYDPDLNKTYDLEGSLGLKFQPQKIKWLKSSMVCMKLEGSILPFTIDEKIDIYNQTAKSKYYQRFNKVLKKQRNYSLTIGLQYYL